jgi:hypothetical protein
LLRGQLRLEIADGAGEDRLAAIDADLGREGLDPRIEAEGRLDRLGDLGIGAQGILQVPVQVIERQGIDSQAGDVHPGHPGDPGIIEGQPLVGGGAQIAGQVTLPAITETAMVSRLSQISHSSRARTSAAISASVRLRLLIEGDGIAGCPGGQ